MTQACFIIFAQHNERTAISFPVASQSTEICARIATRCGLDGPGSNPVGGEIFRSRPHRPGGPASLQYNGHRVFPGVKRPERDDDYPPLFSAEVKERITLHFYSPSGASWLGLGRDANRLQT